VIDTTIITNAGLFPKITIPFNSGTIKIILKLGGGEGFIISRWRDQTLDINTHKPEFVSPPIFNIALCETNLCTRSICWDNPTPGKYTYYWVDAGGNPIGGEGVIVVEDEPLPTTITTTPFPTTITTTPFPTTITTTPFPTTITTTPIPTQGQVHWETILFENSEISNIINTEFSTNYYIVIKHPENETYLSYTNNNIIYESIGDPPLNNKFKFIGDTNSKNQFWDSLTFTEGNFIIYPKLNNNVYLTIHTSGHLSVHAQTGANNQIFSSNLS
jgi:hypothetical protein